MFAGKKSAQIREILISESAWEEMTCLFAPSLEITNYSVTDIAYESGYSSPSLFIKTFKKLTSFTPSSYRKHLTSIN